MLLPNSISKRKAIVRFVTQRFFQISLLAAEPLLGSSRILPVHIQQVRVFFIIFIFFFIESSRELLLPLADFALQEQPEDNFIVVSSRA